jgi:trk system potassium uptake protein TrkH
MGIGAANLASAESASNNLSNMRSRMSDVAKRIFLIYLILTGIELFLLFFSGIGLYDSLLLTLQSVGNGGFIHTGGGVMGYSDGYIEVVVSVFCILSALSFMSYPLLFKRKWREFFAESELRMFASFLLIMIALVAVSLMAGSVFDSPAESLRHGSLATISFITTSGFSSGEVSGWPEFTQWLLLFAMAIGGCSASTSGGIKMVRLSVLFSVVRRNVYKRVHPNAVVSVKVGGKAISDEKVSMITTFFIVYVVVTLLSFLVLSIENLDMKSTISTVIAMMSNTGQMLGTQPGLDSLAGFSPFSKLYLIALMITGRLEIMTVFLLFTPAFWRTSK